VVTELNVSARSAPLKLSPDGAPVQVWMIPTDEEAVLARAAAVFAAG
jgi:acetate kinase